MAVLTMKKVFLLALERDREAILSRLQRFGRLQIAQVTGQDEILSVKGAETAKEIARQRDGYRDKLGQLDALLAELAAFDSRKPGFMAPKPALGLDEIETAMAQEAVYLAQVERCEEFLRRMRALEARQRQLQGQAEQLAPYRPLTVPVESVADTRDTVAYLGSVAAPELAALKEAAAQQPLAALEVIAADAAHGYILLVAHRSVAGEMGQCLARASFSRAAFPFPSGTPSEMAGRLEGQLKADEEERARLGEQLAAQPIAPLELYYDALSVVAERWDQACRLGNTDSVFYLTGWVPARSVPGLEAAVAAVSSTAQLTLSDPEPEDDPPTALTNHALAEPQEDIVNMFASPQYTELDPTALTSPFYLCFFGMMVSDAGYGIVLALACGLLLLRSRPARSQMNMIKMIGLGGLFTAFWGVMYGSYFGYEWFPPVIMSPMGDPLSMLIMCFGFGILHLVTGLVTKMVVSFKAGDWQAAVFDAMPWVMILVGLPLLAGSMLGVAWLPAAGMALVIAGAALILLFTERKSFNPIVRIGKGLYALYGVTSYLSDILSYSRLFALGLCTGVVAMVINTIVGMLAGNPVGMVFAALIFAGGHVINIAINALGAYVHSSRLQYVEFFGKFYDGGGHLFEPLAARGKYHQVTDGLKK